MCPFGIIGRNCTLSNYRINYYSHLVEYFALGKIFKRRGGKVQHARAKGGVPSNRNHHRFDAVEGCHLRFQLPHLKSPADSILRRLATCFLSNLGGRFSSQFKVCRAYVSARKSWLVAVLIRQNCAKSYRLICRLN